MDYRPYILAGTFLLFVVALIAFFATLSAVRRRRVEAKYEAHSLNLSRDVKVGEMLDTSLEGLELDVADDTPSAALLTPLRAGEWMPPDTPAPINLLEDASLAGRGADYDPIGRQGQHHEPSVPAGPVSQSMTPSGMDQMSSSQAALIAAEAAASVAQIAAAASAAQAAAAASAAQAAAAVSALQAAVPLAALPGMSAFPVAYSPATPVSPDAVTMPFPAVPAPAVPTPDFAAMRAQPVAMAPTPATPGKHSKREAYEPPAEDDLTAAIAALSDANAPVGVSVIAPGEWQPPVIGGTTPEPAAVPQPVVVPAPVVTVVPEVPPAAPEVVSVVPPVAEMPLIDRIEAQMDAAQQPSAPEVPEVVAAQAAEPEVIPAASSEPQVQAVARPEPSGAAQSAAGPVGAAAPQQDWDSLLREQQSLPTSPAKVRPAAVVSSAVVPAPVEAQAVPVPVARKVRPQARVHSREDADTRPATTVKLAPLQAGPAAKRGLPSREKAPEIVMEAPVEMWFGDARVGVKAGTATYEKFRKYADVLFADLKGSERAGV